MGTIQSTKTFIGKQLASQKLWQGVLTIHLIILVGLAIMQIAGLYSKSDDAPSPSPTDAIISVSLFLALPVLAASYFTGLRFRKGIREDFDWHVNIQHAAIGFGAGLGLLGLTILVNAVKALLTDSPAGGPNQEFVASTHLVVAAFLSIIAAFSEELYFRGFVQGRYGVWVQSILFGALHFSIVNPIQPIIALASAFIFGFMIHKRLGLISVMIAHFTFNFAQFVGAKVTA